LLEICPLTDTLVIDEDGLYDPNQYNDRLLLGFRGTLSEAELHWLRSRLLGGKLEKARQGQSRFRLPVGLVFDAEQRIQLDPDAEVQQAVRVVFAVFDDTGSALAVVKYFADGHLPFPTRFWGGRHADAVVCGPLRHRPVLAMLHNPVYAGAYVYGRTRTRSTLLPGESPHCKGRTRRVEASEWQFVQLDAFSGYITWTQFLSRQQQLADNRTDRQPGHRGAVRAGRALLQGLVRCGVYGRRMSVRYLNDGHRPQYECNRIHTHPAGRTCQSRRGDGIDAAAAQAFHEAMTPAQLAVSLEALEQLEERARYEADGARHRFLSVEPENRLVARNLEHDWNDKPTAVELLEREYAALPSRAVPRLTDEERHDILALAQDLPTLWHAHTTTALERKHLLRLLIKDNIKAHLAPLVPVVGRWGDRPLGRESARPHRRPGVCR
jgi:hypothetical protein